MWHNLYLIQKQTVADRRKLKMTYRKEEVIFVRRWNALKTGITGRLSSVQPHQQPAGEDGRAKERVDRKQ